MTDDRRRILVIKLGALGDFVLASGPFAAIRHAHPDDEIVLLTTAPFAALGKQSGFFDEIWVDGRPTRLDLAGRWRLRRRLRGGRFARVYDLQTSARTSSYFRYFSLAGRPEWSGIAPGCSHPHANPNRDALHTLDRQAEQLAAAGIASTPPPDLSWATADIARFGLPPRIVLLVPGAAPHRAAKRWPGENFAALARAIAERGATPVIVGGAGDTALAAEIADGSGAISLAGETTIADLAELARHAAAAVGNDTGPMHIAAICGCPSLVLFSSDSDPALTAPRAAGVAVLQRENLADIDVSTVADALSLR